MKLTVFFLLFAPLISMGQMTVDEVNEARALHISNLKDSTQGILTISEIESLGQIDYFPYDPSFVFTGKFTKSIGKKFKMPTSTDRTPIYRRFGYVDFVVELDTFRLEIYQNIALSKEKEYKNYLFIPFKDGTSAKETYGGGRYLDLKIPNDSTILIDFNLAYNPYCAYSYRYSCPIPPKVNHLTIDISAGEKTPQGHN